MRTPNLNSLRMFDAAVRHLNFRLAAEELNLTQGAVAQQVRRLESDLGVKLFHRLARGLALTESGNSYHAAIRRALDIIEDANRKLAPENERITISVTPSFATKWLVPRLVLFSDANPEIEVQTIASEELANFRSDGVDIAIRQGSPPFEESLEVELLAPLDLCAVCSPDYAAQADPVEQFGDFESHRLIQDGHKQWEELFKAVDKAVPLRMMKFNQTAHAVDAAANGQGVTLAPRLLLDAELKNGKLEMLWQDDRIEQQGYYVIHPKGHNSTASDKVIAWLLSEAKHDRRN